MTLFLVELSELAEFAGESASSNTTLGSIGYWELAVECLLISEFPELM